MQRTSKRKPLKIVIFVICTVGFLYQTTEFLKLYFKYPTIVEIQQIKPEYLELPAVSICMNSRLMKIDACRIIQNTCAAENRTLLCKLKKRYCQKRQLKVQEIGTELLRNLNESNRCLEQNGHKKEDVFNVCQLETPTNVINCSNFMRYPVFHAQGNDLTLCYGIESLWGKPDESPKRLSTSTNMSIVMALLPEECTDSGISSQAHVYIHDPYTISSPALQGISLRRGKRHLIHVEKVTKNLLQFPYVSNCRNYIAECMSNNEEGPLNQQMCIDVCKIEASVTKRGCVHPSFIFSHHYEICSEDLNDTCSMDDWILCHKSCKEVCTTQKVFININFQGMQQMLYTHRPKYEVHQMFSYIGGCMGIWLGMSFVSLFELIEWTTRTLYCQFQSMRMKIKQQAMSPPDLSITTLEV